MKNMFKTFCNRCKNETNHSVKCELKFDDIEEAEIDGQTQTQIMGYYSYQIIECNGCESISYRNVSFFNSLLDLDADTDKPIRTGPIIYQRFFPERMKGMLIEKKITGLPQLIRIAYREIIDSYNYDLRILCAGGLRAIVEGICAHFLLNGEFLNDRINGLSNTGLIGQELSESLKIHKFLGNQALHRLEIPEKEDLESAINLIELVLESLFEVPLKHKKLKNSVIKKI